MDAAIQSVILNRQKREGRLNEAMRMATQAQKGAAAKGIAQANIASQERMQAMQIRAMEQRADKQAAARVRGAEKDREFQAAQMRLSHELGMTRERYLEKMEQGREERRGTRL
jgi:hypothetical protein